MRSFLIVLTLLISIHQLSAQSNKASNKVKVGDHVPAFTFEIEPGKWDSITHYKGKLVLINFFATWCPPCRKELPQLQTKIWEKHKSNPRFALLVFGREEGWDVLHPFKEKFKYTFPILPDLNRKVFGLFATESIPRNYLIDENGKIIYQSIGYEEAEFDQLIQLIDKKLKK